MSIVSDVGQYYAQSLAWVPSMPETWDAELHAEYVRVVVVGSGLLTDEQFTQVHREVCEMCKLLRAAAEIDGLLANEANGLSDDNKSVLRKVAELVGQDLDDVFGSDD